MPENVCVCVYHENFSILENTFTKATSAYKLSPLTSTSVCDPESKDCMFGNCHLCNDQADALLSFELNPDSEETEVIYFD
jgi:hypothetical protein